MKQEVVSQADADRCLAFKAVVVELGKIDSEASSLTAFHT
jgi:hypothetical protein